MNRATRSERRGAKRLGVNIPLYRRARRAGATHDEILSAVREGRSFWRYEMFRTARASHAEALALESEGVDAVSFRDLRRIGICDDDLLDASRREIPLDVYFSARKAGLAHDDAAALIDAGFQHAANARVWKTVAQARQLLANREQATPTSLSLLVLRAPGFKGDVESLVKKIAADEGSGDAGAARVKRIAA